LPKKRHLWGSTCVQAITFQVEVNTLEKMFPVEQIITAPFQYLELVVEALHKAAVLTLHEIISDLLLPVFQGVQKIIEAFQFTSGAGSSRRENPDATETGGAVCK